RGEVSLGSVALIGAPPGQGPSGLGVAATVLVEGVRDGAAGLAVTSSPVAAGGLTARTPAAANTATATPAPPRGNRGVPLALQSPTVGTDGTFKVDVVITNDHPIEGYQFGIARFDPAIVHVVKIDEGPYLASWAADHGGGTARAGSWTPDNTAGS